jgi:hypothetical protein
VSGDRSFLLFPNPPIGKERRDSTKKEYFMELSYFDLNDNSIIFTILLYRNEGTGKMMVNISYIKTGKYFV